MNSGSVLWSVATLQATLPSTIVSTVKKGKQDVFSESDVHSLNGGPELRSFGPKPLPKSENPARGKAGFSHG
jgi:hypothetical protein